MEKKTVHYPTYIFNDHQQITGTNYQRKIGIYLYRLVFNHGQLYLALFSSTKQENVKIALTETGKNSKYSAETSSDVKSGSSN